MNKDKIKKILYDVLIKYQGLLVILLLIDQITKILALNFLKTPIKIFGIEWLELHFTTNSGVAFSMFKDAPQVIGAIISLVASGALEYYLIAKKPKDKIFQVMLIVLIAGALGNGIDRWLSVFGKYTGYTGVIDFIYPTFFANFNVADIYVSLTCIALLIYFIFSKDESEPTLKEMKEANETLDKLENNDLETSEETLVENKESKNE